MEHENKIVKHNRKTAQTEAAFKHGFTVTHILISLNKHKYSGCESKHIEISNKL